MTAQPRYDSSLTPVESRELADGALVLILGTLNNLITNREDNLDVARVALVGVDTTVSAVCTTAGFL